MNFADCTKYEKIYGSTYWGHYMTQHYENDQTFNTMIENRNNFIQKFNIKKHTGFRSRQTPKWVLQGLDINSHEFDHNEVYKIDSSTYIILSSPYYGLKTKSFFESMGFDRYDGVMYPADCQTYFKIVKKEPKSIIITDDNYYH
jgi:hypothetical protein